MAWRSGHEPAMPMPLAGVDQAVAWRVYAADAVALVHVDQAAARPGARPSIAPGEHLGAELAQRASIDGSARPA